MSRKKKLNEPHLPRRENMMFGLFPHGTSVFIMKCSFAFAGPSVSNLMTRRESGVRVVCASFFVSCRADKSS